MLNTTKKVNIDSESIMTQNVFQGFPTFYFVAQTENNIYNTY